MTPPTSAAEAAEAAIVLQDLSVCQGRQTVLDRLHWQVPTGQVVGLLGRNGSGKTTLLETVLGLREPDAGVAQLLGRPSASLDDATRARIGYVPQHSQLFEWMTAAQMLAYFRSFYPRWHQAKVDGLLSRWAIDAELPIRQLSGGQQQRLSIVRALAHEPDLLLLDEPVSSLDPAARRDFLQELITQVLDRQVTVVFSTHILSDLERVAVEVAFLVAGRILLQSPLDGLMEGTRWLRGASAAVEQQLHAQGWQCLHERMLPQGMRQVLARHERPEQVANWPGTAVDKVSLEDLFLALTA